MNLQATFLKATPQVVNPAMVDVSFALGGPGIGGTLSLTFDSTQVTLSTTNVSIETDTFSPLNATDAAALAAAIQTQEATSTGTLDAAVAADQVQLATDQAADNAAKTAQTEESQSD
jgi:hypothetical protein